MVEMLFSPSALNIKTAARCYFLIKKVLYQAFSAIKNRGSRSFNPNQIGGDVMKVIKGKFIMSAS